jgi:protein-disulfide isomerase
MVRSASATSMESTKRTSALSAISRRQWLIGGAVVVVAAAGGGAFLWSQSDSSIASGGQVSMATLLAPGPLPDESIGAADAPVVIVEYASMTCPHCAHFAETTFPELKRKYIDTGKVRFIFREFPLDALATAASLLARCAGKDRYFPMIETLFRQQRDWVLQNPLERLFGIARQAGFTQQSFDECLANQQLTRAIEQTRDRGSKLGVNSTPSFFINGKLIHGALTAQELDKQLAPYLPAS